MNDWRQVLGFGKLKKKITILCKDHDDKLSSLLEYIKRTGNIGHSFSIVVDPDDSKYKKEFGWDGDGADKIESIDSEDLYGSEE